MGDIKWIKIYTDMVNNKKIKSIRKMPEGNNIVLIWVLLIAQAGESNKKGALYLTDTIPFTLDDLAVQLDFEKKVVQLALAVLEKYSMIEIFDDIIYIKNWEKYQNIEGMEKIREQTRVRVLRHREQQKLIACNVTVTLPVTQGNAIEQELEQDKELDNKETLKSKEKSVLDSVPENIRNEIKDFIDFRKKVKSPMTDGAVKILVKKLSNITSDVDYQKAILEQSIVNGWKSVYEIKGYADIGSGRNQVDLKKISEGVFKI